MVMTMTMMMLDSRVRDTSWKGSLSVWSSKERVLVQRYVRSSLCGSGPHHTAALKGTEVQIDGGAQGQRSER